MNTDYGNDVGPNVGPARDALDIYVICSCGAEWWLDYEPPACDCAGDDTESHIEMRQRNPIIEHTLREPCVRCDGGSTGIVTHVNGQWVARCANCGFYQYTVPRREMEAQHDLGPSENSNTNQEGNTNMSNEAQKDFFDEAAGGTGHDPIKFSTIGQTIAGIIMDEPRVVKRPNLNDGSPEKQMPINLDVDGTPRTLWVRAGQLAGAIKDAYEAAGCDGLAKGGKLGVKYVEDQDTGKPNPMKVFAAKYEPPVQQPNETSMEDIF